MIFSEDQKITLSTQKNPDSRAYRYLEKVYVEAFRRLGKEFSIQVTPLRRSSYLSDKGDVDGELSRVYSYGESHPSVLRVEEPHWTVRFLAISKDPNIHLEGWDSLGDTEYRISYQRGVLICERNLTPLVPEERLEELDFGHYGLDFLLSGRTDIFVVSEVDLKEYLSQEKYGDMHIHVAGVMQMASSHAYLHEKNSELVTPLGDILSTMKREGLLKKYRDQTGVFIHDDFFK